MTRRLDRNAVAGFVLMAVLAAIVVISVFAAWILGAQVANLLRAIP